MKTWTAKEMETMSDDKEVKSPSPEENAGGACDAEAAGEDSLEAELEASRLEAERYKDEAARAKADFYNYRTRVERDRAKDRILASENAVTELLPVLDNLERALGAEPDKDSSMYKGILMVQRQFFGVMQNLGLKVIEANGMFDPALHEAVMTSDAGPDEEDGGIASVLGIGYMLGDKVLRAARVNVARKKTEETGEE